MIELLTSGDIARSVGATISQVQHAIKARGIKPALARPQVQFFTREQAEIIGATVQAIASSPRSQTVRRVRAEQRRRRAAEWEAAGSD